ncbi:MAG: V4R domain-containing protein [Candidatus Omnitrophota bacterium]
MAYDYQKLLKEREEKDAAFTKKLNATRQRCKNVVGKEAGIAVVGDIEDIAIGRPTLGGAEFVINFRILRIIGLKWNLSGLLGEKASDGIVYSIGIKLGRDLVSSGLIQGKDGKEFVTNFAQFIVNMKIGVPTVVEWKGDFPNIIKVDECISCGGMMNIGEPICHYEGGVIAGALSEYFKGLIVATEVLCWGHGEETCQFELCAK